MIKYILIILTALTISASADQKGKASYYYKHQKTAWGQWFKNQPGWCAHKTLPKGTRLKVTNLRNGKVVYTTVLDRGPFIPGRIIDLSKTDFGKIESIKKGLCYVKIEVIK